MKCPRCQHQNRPQAKFCEECANPFKGASPPAQLHPDPKTEVESLRRALSEALEQQTATAEILQVISSSPTDIQPVLDTVAENAARVCGADDAVIVRLDGDVMHTVAGVGQIPKLPPDEDYPVRGSVVGRAVKERRTIHIHDIAAESEAEFPVAKARQRVLGIRTVLVAPLLREGVPIGGIVIRRLEVRPFSDGQVKLLETFADQAVIAIENVRLFTELREKNQALTATHAQVTEALEQQTATSEILRVISSSPTDVQPVFDIIAASALTLCDADYSAVTLYDGEVLHLVALANVNPEGAEALRRAYPRRADGGHGAGRAVSTRAVVQIPDVLEDRAYELKAEQQAVGFRSILAVPMLRDGEPIGAISLGRREPRSFSEKHVALLQTFSTQAVIAIENVRLFKELEARNRELTAALERETASADLLRIIAASPTDLTPVFESILDRALILCGATVGGVLRYDGGLISVAAAKGPPEVVAAVGATYPRRLDDRGLTVQSIRERRTVHVADTLADPSSLQATRSIRGQLSVPMLKDGEALGAIVITRPEPGLFSDGQVKLLETFADQAVIAIENVRLFNETKEALEQQTATAEILRVISSSPTDVQRVFETIVAKAVDLCRAHTGVVFRFDGRLIHVAAAHSLSPEVVESLRQTFPMSPGRASAAGRAILTRSMVYIPNIREDLEYGLQALANAADYLSVVAVPMLHESKPIGTITVTGAEAGAFSQMQIELLQTFADQAVIAIENARLFTQLSEKNQALAAAHAQVTEALEQQTATSEILRVISGSTTDAQPVFDSIVGSACRLCEATFSLVSLLVDGELTLGSAQGVDPAGIAALRRSFPRPPTRENAAGRAVLDQRLVHIEDATVDPEYTYPERELLGVRSVLAVPMVREGTTIGAIAVWRPEVRPFTDKQIALLRIFADQAVIAIENVRLFNETKEALEQQTATADILRVIASSPTDLQPVMEAVAVNAARVCGATDSTIFRLEGEHLRLVARHGSLHRALAIGDTFAVSRATVSGRAVCDRRTIHVEDIMAAEAEFPATVSAARQAGSLNRTMVGTPLLREGTPLGAIIIHRGPEFHPFSAKQIALLETFANQAVIAIENVRLFQELRARTAELTRSVERLTALSEVSRAVSSTLEVEAVLNTVVARANQLAGADACTIYEYDENSEQFHLRATHNLAPEFVEGDAPPER